MNFFCAVLCMISIFLYKCSSSRKCIIQLKKCIWQLLSIDRNSSKPFYLTLYLYINLLVIYIPHNILISFNWKNALHSSKHTSRIFVHKECIWIILRQHYRKQVCFSVWHLILQIWINFKVEFADIIEIVLYFGGWSIRTGAKSCCCHRSKYQSKAFNLKFLLIFDFFCLLMGEKNSRRDNI